MIIRQVRIDLLEEVKEKLLSQPESIANILDHFGFSRISIRNNEIRCGFEEGSNPTAISIRLIGNENLFVKDYSRNMTYDLINYLVKSKGIPFKEVISVIKKELKIENLYTCKKKSGLFGGLYNNLSSHNGTTEIKTYDEDILKRYKQLSCDRFLRDGISLKTQKKFNVAYDTESQRIVFPLRTVTGEIASVKGRLNYAPEEWESKYLYMYGTMASQLLFGVWENYDSLYGADTIYVFESEKSVMQADTFGVNNCVALGSNSLSTAQARILMSLNPKSITMMLDRDLPLENTMKNIKTLQAFSQMRDIKFYFWNWGNNITLDEKSSPTDGGKAEFEYIINNELEEIKS